MSSKTACGRRRNRRRSRWPGGAFAARCASGPVEWQAAFRLSLTSARSRGRERIPAAELEQRCGRAPTRVSGRPGGGRPELAGQVDAMQLEAGAHASKK